MIFFALATIGLTNTLVHGRIFDDEHLGFRSWLKRRLGKYADALDCYECSGFWCGLLVALCLFSWCNPLIILPAAFAGAGLMHAYVNIMNLIESKTDFIVGDDHEPEQPK